MISYTTYINEIRAVETRINHYAALDAASRNIADMRREYAVFLKLMLAEVTDAPADADRVGNPVVRALGALRTRLSTLINESRAYADTKR